MLPAVEMFVHVSSSLDPVSLLNAKAGFPQFNLFFTKEVLSSVFPESNAHCLHLYLSSIITSQGEKVLSTLKNNICCIIRRVRSGKLHSITFFHV